jgi:hypothetical protein
MPSLSVAVSSSLENLAASQPVELKLMSKGEFLNQFDRA